MVHNTDGLRYIFIKQIVKNLGMHSKVKDLAELNGDLNCESTMMETYVKPRISP